MIEKRPRDRDDREQVKPEYDREAEQGSPPSSRQEREVTGRYEARDDEAAGSAGRGESGGFRTGEPPSLLLVLAPERIGLLAEALAEYLAGDAGKLPG